MLPEPQSIEFLLNLLNSSCDWLFDGLKRYHSEHPEVEDGFRRIDAAFSHIQYKMQDELCKLDYDTNMVQLEAEEVDTVFLFKAKWMLVILKLESDKPTLGPERSILLEDLVLNFDFHVRCFGVLDSQDIIPRIKNSELHDWCKTDGKDKEILEFLARFLQKRDKLFLECYERHCSSYVSFLFPLIRLPI